MTCAHTIAHTHTQSRHTHTQRKEKLGNKLLCFLGGVETEQAHQNTNWVERFFIVDVEVEDQTDHKASTFVQLVTNYCSATKSLSKKLPWNKSGHSSPWQPTALLATTLKSTNVFASNLSAQKSRSVLTFHGTKDKPEASHMRTGVVLCVRM